MSNNVSIDPRGPRFTAAVTLVVLAVALLLPVEAARILILAQAAFFAIGVGLGVQFTPTGLAFRHLIRPRLSPPADLEDSRPPRFAQGVGLAFMIVALIGYFGAGAALAQVAVGFALIAATLNAVFGFCLGCEMYLLGLRLTRRTA